MTLTTEEEIARLEGYATSCIQDDDSTTADVLCAIAYEIRALRLMLREEIREAAWRVSPDYAGWTVKRSKPIAGLPYDQEAVPEKLHEAVVEGKDVP